MSVSQTVRVDLGTRSYDIVVGAGVLGEAGDRIAAVVGKRRVIVITDQNVAARHLAPLERSLAAAGVAMAGPALALPPGEGSKSFSCLEQTLDAVLARGIDRGTVLIALGGGVIGDLTGFIAAITLRGLDFIQIPTSLLAQVDSSVGGKTGINSRHGKNLIGAFHQPLLVLADIATLDTLEPRHVRAGYAEVVKYGLINDPAFFDWLEAHAPALLAGDREARVHAVVASCRAKAAVVGVDERESGERALLNLGHTFGHALETACGYDDRLYHGEAVAVGMVLAFELSVRLGLCPAADALRVRRHLFAAGLPTGPGDLPTTPWRADELVGYMAHDKKTRDGRLTFILARGVGRSFIARDVDAAEVEAVVAGHA